jgi:hypothetical protein
LLTTKYIVVDDAEVLSVVDAIRDRELSDTARAVEDYEEQLARRSCESLPLSVSTYGGPDPLLQISASMSAESPDGRYGDDGRPPST